MRDYKLGDKVWVAQCEYREVSQPCLVCFGKKEAMVTLGNGTEVMVECDYCGHGRAPTGIGTEYEWVAGTVQVGIMEVRITSSDNKYVTRLGILEDDLTFDDEESARVKSLEMQREHEITVKSALRELKHNKYKSLLWHVGYYLQQAEQARRDIVRYEKLARICKDRSSRKEVKE